MIVYRIFNRRYDALDARGAAAAGGRWNPVGHPVVYAAAAYEGALLEQLVHAGTGTLPPNRWAARIVLPDPAGGGSITDATPALPGNWTDEAVSQAWGADWLTRAQELAVLVPSVVARPWGRNVLINPAHPDFARERVEEEVDVVWDPGLGAR